MKLPVIVERNAWNLPQERYNCAWVREQDVGLVLRNFRGIAAAVKELLEPAIYARMRSGYAAADSGTTGWVILQGHNGNSGRREIVANRQNRFVPLRGQSVSGAVSEIQLRAMAHALPKSSECGEGLLCLSAPG